MSKESISIVLEKYIPAAAVDLCCRWIVQHNIHVRITKSRSSKFGDYRPLKESGGHRITINHDLNKYAFLITFVHEVAHLIAETHSKKSISPHGKEWKNEFSRLLGYFLTQNIFPSELISALQEYAVNPAASSCSDLNLLRALRKYDKKEQLHIHHLEDLPHHTLFRLSSSRSRMIFRKGVLIRTRFHCQEVNTKREYVVSPLAEVVIHEVPQEGIQLKVSGF